MEVIFTKQIGRGYGVRLRRQDGCDYELRSFDRKLSLPHDITHFVVERELGLERGLWGSIARGAVFENMRHVRGRRPPHSAQQSKSVIQEMDAEAEVLVSQLFAIFEKGWEDNWPAASALLKGGWRPRHPSRPPVTAEEVKRTCLALREVQTGWNALSPGGAMTISWSSRKPRKRYGSASIKSSANRSNSSLSHSSKSRSATGAFFAATEPGCGCHY
ncbi:MAG TPA: hypothetical protein VM870_02850 [Pyrinomonadaceae bacterium]|nr:hypothetical protein [Pyrinomonadaceae bacterium]